MTDRLEKIFSIIPECEIFADIGCDHGYMAHAMLTRGKAKKVIIADISEKCLQKAQDLLYPYINNGKAESVVANGFLGVPESDVGLVAGMGGEEICAILTGAKSLPKTLVLQPMKNTDKVRLCVVDLGYKIEKDYVFKSANKFYDIMLVCLGKDTLTEQEIEFGRDNIKHKSQDFLEFINQKIVRLTSILSGQDLSDEDRQKMLKLKEKLEKYV